MTRRWPHCAALALGLLGLAGQAPAQERPPAVRVPEPRPADASPPRISPAQESGSTVRITTPLRTDEHSVVRRGGVLESETLSSRSGFRANGPGLTETRRCGGGSSVAVGLAVVDCPVVAESVDSRASLTQGARSGGLGASAGVDLSVGRETRYAPDKPTFDAQQARGVQAGEPVATRTDTGTARVDASIGVSVRGVEAQLLSSGIGLSSETTTAARRDVAVPPPSSTLVQSLGTPWGTTTTQIRRSEGQAPISTTTDERGNRTFGPYASNTRECEGSRCRVVGDELGLRLRGGVEAGGPVGGSVEASASVSLGNEYSTGRETYEARYQHTLQRLRDDDQRTGQEGYLGANDARSPFRVQTLNAQLEADLKLDVGPRVSVDVLGGGAGYTSKITRSADEDALRSWDAGKPARELQRAQARITFERLQHTNQQAEERRLEAQRRQAEAARAAAAAAAADRQSAARSSQPDVAGPLLLGVGAAAKAYVQRRSTPAPAAATKPSGETAKSGCGTGPGVCVAR